MAGSDDEDKSEPPHGEQVFAPSRASVPASTAKELPSERTVQTNHMDNRLEERKRAKDLYLDRLRSIRDVVIQVIGEGHRADFDDQLLARVATQVDYETLYDPEEPELSGSSARENIPVLTGSLDSVRLRVRAAVDRFEQDPVELMQFIEGQLAATVADLERRSPDDREPIVDMVITALQPIGSILRPEIIEKLYGYLMAQTKTDRGPGFYTTVGTLAQLLSSSTSRSGDWLNQSVFLYHAALLGIYNLTEAGVATESDRTAMGTVAVSANNACSMLATALQDLDAIPPGAPAVLTRLGTINVTWSPVTRAPSSPEQVTEDLGLAVDNPAAVLTVVAEMGSVSAAWGASGGLDDALLGAIGAVAAASMGRGRQVPARLFNAGVSLLQAARHDPNSVRARLVLNALGLQWSLWQSGDLKVALEEFDGLDCCVNFMGAVVESDQLRSAVSAMAQSIAHLTRWGKLLDSPADGTVEDVVRLRSSLGRLLIDEATEEWTESGFRAKVWEGLQAQVGTLNLDFDPPDQNDSRVLATASVVRAALSQPGLRPPGEWGLLPLVENLVESRKEPRRALLREYAPLAAGGHYGAGPLVVAGMTDTAAWEALGYRMSKDPGSAATLLRNIRRSGLVI